MEEAGIAEAIAAAVQAAHPHLHGLLWSNVLLTGGWGWLAVLGLAAPRRPCYMHGVGVAQDLAHGQPVSCLTSHVKPPPHLHTWHAAPPTLLATGGTTRCPGFRERLYVELRPLVPDDYEVGHCFQGRQLGNAGCGQGAGT